MIAPETQIDAAALEIAESHGMGWEGLEAEEAHLAKHGRESEGFRAIARRIIARAGEQAGDSGYGKHLSEESSRNKSAITGEQVGDEVSLTLPGMAAKQTLQLLLARQEELADAETHGPGDDCVICAAEREAIDRFRAALSEEER